MMDVHRGSSQQASAPPTGRAAASTPTRRRALAGVAAVVLGISTGKWGAYLGAPPLFSTDFLLGLAVAGVFIGWALGGAGRPTGAAVRGWPGVVCCLFLGYGCVRFLFGADHSLTAVRDFAPYGYSAIAFVSALSYHRSSAADRARTGQFIQWALLFHLGWVLVIKAVPAIVDVMPVVDTAQNLRLFSLRAATDSTVVGVTAAVFLIRFLRGGRIRDLWVVAASVFVVVTTTARSALLGTAAALALALWLYYCGTDRDTEGFRRRLMLAGAVPALLLLVGVVVPHTAAGEKMLVGFGFIDARTSADMSAIGTARARTDAWSLVLAYVDDNDRTILGFGFGPDFLTDSGARMKLGNGELLRSPHNYVVGTYARLGLIGVLLLTLLLAVAVREILRMRRHAATDVLLSFVVIFPLAFFISAVFGVELETPFGAVPFFWCLGIILSRPSSPRL
jgi:hypothetical protein